MNTINARLSMKTFLKRFPQGFAVSTGGRIYEVVASAKKPQDLPMSTTPGGGFLVVANPQIQDGDERLFIEEEDGN